MHEARRRLDACIKAGLRQPIPVDGRNLYDPRRMAKLGFRYASIGRRAASGVGD